MPGNLQGRTVHIDQHLSNVAINFKQDRWIAEDIFPVVRVPKQSDSFAVWNQADLFRRQDTKRSRGAPAHKISVQVGSDNFFAQNYALKADVTLEDRVNADPIFVRELEEGKVNRVMDGLLLDWEVRIASQVNNTSNVGSSANVASSWLDRSNSDPIADIWTAIDNVQDATGYRPNRIVFGTEAWRLFRRNTAVIDKAVPSGPNVTGGGNLPSVAMIRDLLEMDFVGVGMAYQNTAEEGQDQTLAQAWQPHALIYYAPMAPSIDAPSFGYSFRWNAPGLPNMQVERHPYDSRHKVDEVEVGYYQAEKITSAPLAFLVANVSSSQ